MGFFNNLFGKKKDKPDEVKIGDNVKCIDDIGWGGAKTNITLQYGKVYKVLDIIKCKCCDTLCYDIGGKFTDNSNYTHCGVHNVEVPGRGIHWAGAFRFAKTTQQADEISNTISKENKEELIKQAIAEENYELAHELSR